MIENSNYSNKTITASCLKYKAMGRMESTEQGCILFKHAASGVAITADCQGNVIFNMKGNELEYLTVVIDGVEHELCMNSCEDYDYVVAEGLNPGVHTIEIYRQGQQYTATILNYVNLNGEVLSPPKDKNLLIEFVGDSITSGAGNIVVPPNTEITEHSTDATKAYGRLTAKALDADWSNISAGGGTLSSTLRIGQVVLPENYLLTHLQSNNWDFENARQPDIVVINLGTNDSSFSYRKDTDYNIYIENFETELYAFTKKVIELNSKKDVKVVFAFGMMTEPTSWVTASYKKIVQKLAAEGITVPYCQLPKNVSGGAGHPWRDGHAEASEVLSQFIKDNVLN